MFIDLWIYWFVDLLTYHSFILDLKAIVRNAFRNVFRKAFRNAFQIAFRKATLGAVAQASARGCGLPNPEFAEGSSKGFSKGSTDINPSADRLTPEVFFNTSINQYKNPRYPKSKIYKHYKKYKIWIMEFIDITK